MTDIRNNETDRAVQAAALRRIEVSASPVGRMIMLIAGIAGLIALIIICSVAWIAISGKVVPDVLINWGGIILGFYFGSVLSLIKDYMGVQSPPA